MKNIFFKLILTLPNPNHIIIFVNQSNLVQKRSEAHLRVI
jgi:hypothetical protein